MTSIDRGTRWRYIALTAIAPVAAGILLWWLEFEAFSIVAGVFGAVSMPAYRFAPWLLGPIEWAVFDTTLKDKTIFVFRGRDDAGFDEFVDALDKAIEAAIRSDGNEAGELSDATERRSRAF